MISDTKSRLDPHPAAPPEFGNVFVFVGYACGRAKHRRRGGGINRPIITNEDTSIWNTLFEHCRIR